MDDFYGSFRMPTHPDVSNLRVKLPEPQLHYHCTSHFHALSASQTRPSQTNNIYDRLTDHKYYTGTHKHRFDRNGRGRGLSGRERKVIFDGNTESSTRCHETMYELNQILRQPSKKLIVNPDSKFTEPSRCIWVYRNGDKNHDGCPVYIKSVIKTLPQLLKECTKHAAPFTGCVLKLYDQNLQQVHDLDDFVDGAKYLCCGGESPDLNRLEKFLSPYIKTLL